MPSCWGMGDAGRLWGVGCPAHLLCYWLDMLRWLHMLLRHGSLLLLLQRLLWQLGLQLGGGPSSGAQPGNRLLPILLIARTAAALRRAATHKLWCMPEAIGCWALHRHAVCWVIGLPNLWRSDAAAGLGYSTALGWRRAQQHSRHGPGVGRRPASGCQCCGLRLR